MNQHGRVAPALQNRSLCAAACCLLVIEYCVFVRPMQTQIRAAQSITHALQIKTDANARIIGRLGMLEATQRRVRKDLQRNAIGGDPSKTMALLLRTLEADTRKAHLVLSTVEPEEQRTRSVAKGRLTALPVAVGLRGHFIGFIGFLQAMAHCAPPVGVASIELLAHGEASNPSILDATVRMEPFTIHVADLLRGYDDSH